MRYVTLSVAFASLALLSNCGSPSETEAAIDRKVPVTVVTVAPQTLRPELDLIGTIIAMPERTAQLTSQISGQVVGVNVVEGDFVKAGELVARLDSRLIEADLAKADAALAEARANLAMLEKGPLPEEIEAARQEMRTASATAEGRRAKLKALQQLRENGEIAEVQYETARTAATEAEATARAATERLKLLEQGTRPETLAEAQAKVAAAESDVAAQSLNVDLCTIASPIDGTVTQLTIRQGTYVEKPAVLGTVTDLSVVFARVNVPAENLAALHKGATSFVTCKAAGVADVPGAVERIGEEANPGSGSIDAFVRVTNDARALRPGLSCHVRIALPEVPNALAVPVSAVADRNGVAVVTLVRGGKTYETPVQLGARTNDAIQITSGVNVGDTVVTEGGYGLPDETPVTIMQEKSATP